MFSAEGVQSSSGLRRLLPTSGKDALQGKGGDNFAGNRKEREKKKARKCVSSFDTFSLSCLLQKWDRKLGRHDS